MPKTAQEIIQEGFTSMKADLQGQIAEAVKGGIDPLGEKFQALETTLQNVENKQTELESRLQQKQTTDSLPGLEDPKEREKFSFVRAAMLADPRFNSCKTDKSFGFEYEIMQNMEKRATAVAGDGTKGGYTIPTELSSMIIDLAVAAMPLNQIGMTILPNVEGYLEIPQLTGRGTAGHTSEVGTPSEVSLTWGMKSLTPHRAAGYAVIGNRLNRMSAIGYERYVRQQLILSLGLEIHEKLIIGTGTNNEILGVHNVGSKTTTTALSSAGQFTIRDAAYMQVDLEEADVDIYNGNMGFLMRPIVRQGMQLQRVEYYSGQTKGKGYPWMPLMSNEALQDILNAKVATTTHVPTSGSGSTTTSTVTYGDWSKALMALWTGLTVRTSTEASDATRHSFIQGLMMILAEQDYDFLVTRPDCFCATANAYANRSGWDQA